MPKFRGENFRGWLSNHKIRESFLLRKFPAIIMVYTGTIDIKWGEHINIIRRYYPLIWK